ncbi:GGDEF domain-containing phosphodiesterase [Sulfuricurvum sp.]|uniref:putative bifunctional diguanylate cyclase/phosphodiesterase n=1 Tax=Sulfuricurvum sp. TaxID=2025608 RepID=UPI00261EAA24|nr:GGDEF domain-containing phosphodiesterase [Sulfuricurvum sp.]MDD2838913.1 EAL domain-containing protein [Sulfuricurvum sp.]MDD3596550.1 EAL domain-containing protein [Sulfuricurvum sp.]
MNKIFGRLSFDMLKKIKTTDSQREFEIMATAMKHASDSIIVTDRYNNIMKVNNAFINTFGYGENEVLGKNTRFLSSVEHDNTFYNQMWTTLLREKHWSSEIWIRRKSGKIFPGWVSITAIMDENGKIQNYLAIFTDLSALRESQKRSLKLAYYDQLTGLPNRQKIVSDMTKKAPSVCIIFNIDDFKEINDFFGIEIGDLILSQVAEWFYQMNFSPYRIGGDEFAILLYEDFTWNDLRNRINALMSLFEEKVFSADEEGVNLRMTVGAAIGDHKLLTRADIALNRAKKSKTSIALYTEQENIEEIYRSNMRMSSAIRSALAEGKIRCHYQPIVNLNNDQTEKYETLVRMVDESGNLIPPALFLPVAKKTKLYPQITIEVVNQACSVFSKRDEEFSINLSDSDIRNPHIVKEIIHTIVKTGTASKIVFEILESEGIENYAEVVEFISTVKALGAKIAIDDFGTGYSNFENILKLNVDYIKIDGSLIEGISDNPRHHIVVETIVNFAQKIGAKTIAEFVSSEEIYTAVKALGVDYAQGYFTGKPTEMLSS